MFRIELAIRAVTITCITMLPNFCITAAPVNFTAKDVRVNLHGNVPEHTELVVNAEYASRTCTGDKVIYPYPDEPEKKETVSLVSQTFSAKEKTYPYSINLPYKNIGECGWKLVHIAAQFYTSESQKTTNDKPSYIYFLQVYEYSPRDLPQEIAFTPGVYSIIYDQTKKGISQRQTYLALTDSPPLPWMVKNKTTQRVNLEEGQKISVLLSPHMMPDYVVHVTNVLSADNKGEITMTYPDGTTFFYGPEASKPQGAFSGSGHLLAVFGPENPESRANTLAKATDAASKTTLAKLYEDSVGIRQAPQNKEKAQALYSEAANGGDIKAMRWLAHQAEMRKDEKQQSLWLHKMADAGDKSGLACLIQYQLCKGDDPTRLVDKLRALDGQVRGVSVSGFLRDYKELYSSNPERFRERQCDECLQFND
ncbi:MAG: hypothetical protein ACRC85_11020 [Kluyvera ascorbata]